MAKIGLRNFYYSVATEQSDGSLTYSGATKPGKAISFSFEPNVSSATLYADDALAETDTSTNGGTCTMGLDRYDLQTQATLLGHTYSEEDGVTSNKDDVAPYVGLARIVTVMVDGNIGYRAVIFPKVKFQEPSSDNSTKGETTEFGTYEIQGTVTTPADGDWRKEQIFTSQAAADSWIASYFGASPVSA
jgi:phi13 family phage major tail protein